MLRFYYMLVGDGMMKVYHDQDADLNILEGKGIAVIGYGNQGRAQALNLRDSGLKVIVGNREDEYAERAREDGFTVLPIQQAAEQGEIVMLLIPDEVMPGVFEAEIAPGLEDGDVLVFASGYNIALKGIVPPSPVDVVLVAPRMIGAGVRDLYVAGRGFPSFIGVAQDRSGQAKGIALALAKGIGSTRFGVVEVTFAQEAELDLFTEQCFGPAFGHVLTTAVDVLLEEGYPPEAVLLELYMSGELSYTVGKIAQLGLIEQSALHSTTSQYGSMSRGMRFILPELRARIREGLEEIRSGQFAQEWATEQEAGCPTLKMLKESARSLPLHRLERELRHALRGEPELDVAAELSTEGPTQPKATVVEPAPGRKPPHLAAPAGTAGEGFLGRVLTGLRRLMGRPQAPPHAGALSRTQVEQVLRRFVAYAAGDPALQEFARRRSMTTHYVLSDVGLEFYMRFEEGHVLAGMGAPQFPAEVRLETRADVLDGMFTGRINAMRAAMTGKLSFKGDAKVAMGEQQIQADLSRLYALAREEAVGDRT